MPYIAAQAREDIGDETWATTPGELNYVFTMAIKNYLSNKKKLSYQTINDIVGALEGAKMEFYRRIAIPYEDKKIAEHGDVY